MINKGGSNLILPFNIILFLYTCTYSYCYYILKTILTLLKEGNFTICSIASISNCHNIQLSVCATHVHATINTFVISLFVQLLHSSLVMENYKVSIIKGIHIFRMMFLIYNNICWDTVNRNFFREVQYRSLRVRLRLDKLCQHNLEHNKASYYAGII